MDTIKKVSPLVREVSLLDKYKETRTFHIVYRSDAKNLSNDEVGELRETIIKAFQKK
jgi:phenylalanyl-tRNA synthetase beta subunit